VATAAITGDDDGPRVRANIDDVSALKAPVCWQWADFSEWVDR